MTQEQATGTLNLSSRQISRLLQKLNQAGVSGLMHASHRQSDDSNYTFLHVFIGKIAVRGPIAKIIVGKCCQY
ncbi:hypothetical protein E0H80_09690 [Acinetobacter sp. ANC 4779]|uniref:hypothetical protein n=1 Tax=Acinetobacter sp. ANC 4779 TaxID=2529848 RepID=UPI00103DE53E|nr:hypothetical protein E0H80_09690 [Acinetobacter sp. ANC 4779]